jgi:hypothetical protein
MNRTTLPAPPDPNSVAYAGNPSSWQTAMFQWASQVKQRVETDSAVNIRPVSPFIVGTYTPLNTFAPAGTDTTGNAVATLVEAMIAKGLVSTRNLT